MRRIGMALSQKQKHSIQSLSPMPMATTLGFRTRSLPQSFRVVVGSLAAQFAADINHSRFSVTAVISKELHRTGRTQVRKVRIVKMRDVHG